MPRRPNRAKVEDQTLGAAFAEGVNEGFRLTGYCLVSVRIGGKEVMSRTVKVAEVPDLVHDALKSLRGEHYEVGIVIRILSEGDVTTAPAGETEQPALGEEEIEEADVVE